MLRKIEQMAKPAWPQRLAAGATLLYLSGLLLLPLLWMQSQESFWLLILFRWAPPLCYLVLWFGVSLLDLLVRRQRAAPSVLLSGLLTLWLYSGFCWPAFHAPKAEFSVLSYNIRAGLGGPEKIGRALGEQKVDILALQEVRTPLVAKGGDPYGPILEELKTYRAVRGGRKGELVIATPHPILRWSEHPLNQWSAALDAVIEIDGQALRVLNVHCVMGNPRGLTAPGLELSAKARHEQARALVALVQESELPTILLGDFNSPPGSLLYDILAEEMADSFEASGAGFGWTYPSRFPLLRIDQIWCRDLASSTCEVLEPGLSDHRLIRSSFAWLSPQRVLEPTPEPSAQP